MGFNSKYTGAEVEKLLDSIKNNALVESISWENIKDRPNSIEGYGIIDVYNKTEINNSLLKYVTLSTDQNITGIKSFINGFKLGDALITYNKDKKAFVFPGNLLVEGGVAWNSSIEGFEPKTITDAVMIDSSTLGINENGEIYVKGGAGGGGGGSIAYPLSWSGYSSGVYDGSASANIAIPSLLSQMTNDSDYITSASVNSLLTDYVQKSGLPVYGLRASSSVGKVYLQKDGVDVANATLALPTKLSDLTNDKIYNRLTIDALGDYIGLHIVNSKELCGIRFSNGNTSDSGNLIYLGGADYRVTNDGWTAVYKLLHAGNYSDYTLPITGGTMSDKIDFDKTHGSILTIRDGRYGQSAVISVGYTESEGDTIKLHIPTAGSYDEYFLLTHHQGATLTTDLAIYGKLHTKDSYRQLYHDSYNGQVAHSILNNIASPYGLLTRIYGNGDVSLQAQRESTNNEYFNLLLNEYGGNVVIGGELHANDTISFVGSGNTAIQFPDGEYIDRFGNIVLPSTTSQWSVKKGSDVLMKIGVDGKITASDSFNVGKTNGVLFSIVADWQNWQNVDVISKYWDENRWDYINITTPTTYSSNSSINICARGYVEVIGDFFATGEITQHSSLVLKDVGETRFLTLKELVALKPYSFRWKDGRDDKLHVGAIADYVKPILPEVISTDKNNIHSMNYANAAWVVSTSLAPYVSKHEEDIAKLKERVKYLEDKLKER